MPTATPTQSQILTVTELTRRVKDLLETNFPSVWIEGEISNLSIAASGHAYFTLKDAESQLSAVMFRGVAARLNFPLRDGLAVVVRGDISVYEKRGQYQIIVSQVLPKGLGALQLAFEELKRKLAAEGLFEQSRKKTVPALPQRIGIVTSPTGAAIRDFLNIIGRRFPNVHIIINPVRVQGVGAAKEIADAIDLFNSLHASRALPLDVLIVTRGGGSLEDLWAFNEEAVARALSRSKIPTISAVGHEIDFTISDFVADVRAPTPSAAAEIVVKAKQEFEVLLEQTKRQLDKDLRLRLGDLRRRLSELAASEVLRRPAESIRQYQQQVDDLGHRLTQATFGTLDAQQARLGTAAEKFKLLSPQLFVLNWKQRLASESRRFDAALARLQQAALHRLDQARVKLEVLSPKSTLQRGYSITRLADGRIVRTVKTVRTGEAIRTLVADGEFGSVVS